MNNTKALYFDRTDVSEGVNVKKQAIPKSVTKFQPYVWNRCHDVLITLWTLAIFEN